MIGVTEIPRCWTHHRGVDRGLPENGVCSQFGERGERCLLAEFLRQLPHLAEPTPRGIRGPDMPLVIDPLVGAVQILMLSVKVVVGECERVSFLHVCAGRPPTIRPLDPRPLTGHHAAGQGHEGGHRLHFHQAAIEIAEGGRTIADLPHRVCCGGCRENSRLPDRMHCPEMIRGGLIHGEGPCGREGRHHAEESGKSQRRVGWDAAPHIIDLHSILGDILGEIPVHVADHDRSASRVLVDRRRAELREVVRAVGKYQLCHGDPRRLGEPNCLLGHLFGDQKAKRIGSPGGFRVLEQWLEERREQVPRDFQG